MEKLVWEDVFMEKSEAVSRYASLGFKVLLTHGIKDGQCTCGNQDCDHAGKHPLSPQGVHAATDDVDWLRGLLESQPYANIAVAMGRGSGILDLDLDSADAIEEADKKGGTATWSFDSGRDGGGRHLLYRYPTMSETRTVKNGVEVGKKMDVRSDGGYAIVPPSMHASGRKYRWVVEPWSAPLLDVPPWLYDLLVIKDESGPKYAPTNEERVPEGGRNEYLFRFASRLRAENYAPSEISLLVHERNSRLCVPPLPEAEVEGIVASALEFEPGHTGPYARLASQVEEKFGPVSLLPDALLTAPLSDAGNAECLIRLYGNEFRSCAPIAVQARQSKGIFHWTGHVWTEDTNRDFRTSAIWTARARGVLAPQAEDQAARKRHEIWCLSSENIGKLEAMCEIASTSREILVDPDAWDRDEMKLGVLNGVMDLRTGSFIESNPDDYITQVASVKYDPSAKCPTWTRVLGEIFEDRPEVVPYIQRVLGYMLTGLTNEHIMWFWYGSGANGKSTIINTMSAILGDMAGTTDFSTFDDRTENDKNDDLAVLRGKRFVAATEGERSRRIAEAKIKKVVSSDAIRCRFLYGTFFEYRPTWKLVLATNHLPEVKGTDAGIWRRIHMVEFNQSFEGARRDPDLEAKLRLELSGIFNWCLAGLRDYLDKGGFDPPEAVLKSTLDMRTENDTIAQWFEEKVRKVQGESIERTVAFQNYKGWCRDNGEYGLTRVTWQKRLESFGVTFEKKPSGKFIASGWDLETGYD